MGIAAYNRGTAALSREIDQRLPTMDENKLHDLTDMSKQRGTINLFQPTVIRRAETGGWILMNRAEGGWSEHGIPFPTLWAIAKNYRLRFVGYGRDACSFFVGVEPLNTQRTP